MKSSRAVAAIAFLLVVVTLPLINYAQAPGTGLPMFGSLQNGGFDTVNLQNLNTNFVVPVVAHPGRGSGFSFVLGYNSLFWTPSGGTSSKWTPSTHFGFGWTADGPGGTLQYQRGESGLCITGSAIEETNYVFTDPSGTAHPFNVTHFETNACGLQGASTGYATDGSGYFIDILASNGPTVRSSNGDVIVFTGNAVVSGTSFLQGTSINDANGNQITVIVNSQTGETDYVDTLGQTVLKVTSQFNGPLGSISETDYNRLAVDGTYQTIALKYQQFNVKTNFGCTGVAEFTSVSGGGVNLVTEIDLPNGQKYQFSYEPTPGSTGFVTGRLQQVTLPTNGTVGYQYTGNNGGINCTDATGIGLTRTITDGATNPVWTYSRGPGGQGSGVTTITAPQLPYDTAANQTVVTFDGRGRETNRKVYQGPATGNPINTINTSWGTNNTPASVTTILEDGSTQTQVETTYDSSVNSGTGSNGNLLVVKQHDWGSGSPGPVLRTITMTYKSDSNYVAKNVISKVKQKIVTDSAGTTRSRVDINYDEPGFVNANCVTGAPQHDDTNYGCSYTVRGLPTTVTTYTDAATPAGGVTRNASYDSLGNLVASAINNVLQTQWNFSSATQYAFPDSIVSGPPTGPQLTTSFTYHLPNGTVATATNENGQVTSYTYNDLGHLDRLTDVQRPDATHIASSYDDINRIVTVTSPLQGASAVQKIAAFDPLGRLATSTLEDATNNVFSIVQTQYDPLSRPYKTSNPYVTSPQFWTTRQFDALGRATVTILPGGAQTTATYTTNSVTATDAATKQRRSFSDGLGHVIQVDEPGDAFAGTQSSGSITIAGSLGSKSGVNATSGSGSVTMSGSVGFHVVCTRTCSTVWDTGTVSVIVQLPGGSVGHSVSFGASLHDNGAILNALATQFSQDPNFRNVNVTGSTLNLTAAATGSITNYPYSASASRDLTMTTAGPTFTNGSDGQTIFDSGTIVAKVGNFTSAPVCYGQSCNSTASSVANALAGALGAQGSPVGQISVNGSTITMTANQLGAAWNVAVTATPTSGDPADFPQGSFSSQGSLSGGADPYTSGLAHPYSTFYSYGVFDNLLQITQGAQIRTYAYDGMGRLTDTTTPEAGHVTSQYNAFNQVTLRTDARGVNTNYGYDTLNRLHTLSYDVGTTGVPATPAVTYNYGTDPAQNNNGRLLNILDGLGSETYTYDLLGRATQLQKVINGTTYNIGYGYNLAGELTSLTYPSGHVVQQSFDAIGRLCEIAPTTTGCGTATAPYATAYSYNTASETTGFNYGNGVAAGFSFSSDRLQLTSLSYVKGAQTLFGLNYFYKQDSTNCPAGNPGNNGQIQCIADSVDAGRNATYVYDTLGRLSNASTAGSVNYTAWNLSFTYDRYGNRTAQNTSTVSINPQTNQISTLPYDASGNTLNDGTNALAYDAAGRIVTNTQSSVVSTYSYDCKNLRVQKVTAGNTTVYIFSGGKVLAEYVNGAAPTQPTREYIYSGSAMLAKVEAGATSYNLADHLSTRMLTDANGASLGQQGHFPYGDPWYDTMGGNKWKFTTYERDAESQNDYAIARYYINRTGRFTSPDPLSGSVGSPQSLNRYAYVTDNPINSADPTGQFVLGFERNLRFLFMSAAQVFGDYGNCQWDGLDQCGEVQPFLGDEWKRLEMQQNMWKWITMSVHHQGSDGLPGLPTSESDTPSLPSLNPVVTGWTEDVQVQVPADWDSTGGYVNAAQDLLSRPWSFNWILPVLGEPGLAGVGPAGSLAINPRTHTVCLSAGLGASVGHNVSVGPLTQVKSFTGTPYPQSADEILGGWSVSGGFNLPLGPGYQAMFNSSGLASGPTAGSPGLSVAVTDATCITLP